MSNLFMSLVMLTGITLFMMVGARRFTDSATSIATGLMWEGGVLILLAFGTMVWVQPGEPHAFKKNMHDLKKNQDVFVEFLKNVPKLNTSPILNDAPLQSALDGESSHTFLLQAEKGHGIYAWRLTQMSGPVSPELATSIALGFMTGLIALVLTIWNMVTGGHAAARNVGMGNAVFASLSLLIIFSRIAFLDTLGTITDIRIRFIAALAEMRITWAPWWFIIGLFFLLLSGVVFTLSKASSGSNQVFYQDDWKDYYYE